MIDAPILSAAGISRRFGHTVALDDVSVTFEPGTIHALVGENGAGKSTLMRILAGVDRPDGGEIRVAGSALPAVSPHSAMSQGVFLVPQERVALDQLSVVDNVLSSAEALGMGFGSRRRRTKVVVDLCAELGLQVPIAREFRQLSNLHKSLVGILRAAAGGARVLILDEPTAYLATHDAAEYLLAIRRLRDRGMTVIYVSHFLQEVLDIAESITVLRDGRVVHTGLAEGQTTNSLVRAMVGGELDRVFPTPLPTVPTETPPALAVTLSQSSVKVAIRRGEVVALAGLMGSGRTSLALGIIGAANYPGLDVEVDGQRVRFSSPRHALRAGVAYLAEDRKSQGLLGERSIEENASLSRLCMRGGPRFLRIRKERIAAARALRRMAVKHESLGQAIWQLSGGNQQKVLLARCLETNPRVLIVDEPTRGVDVRAKAAIYQLLRDLALEGMAILMISSEIEEVCGLASRAYVLRSGRVVREFEMASTSPEDLISTAFGAEERIARL